MSLGHEVLKTIGAQKIHETTHISRLHVLAVIYESYDDMTKIQFLGFISILEREYDIKLDKLRQRGLDYFNDIAPEPELVNKFFITPKKKKNLTFIYIFLGLFIFVSASYLSLNFSSSKDIKINQLDNTTIYNATQNINPIEEINITKISVDINKSIKLINLDINLTIENSIKNINKTFLIKTNVDLWLGYMDLDTYKKYQKTVKKANDFSIDANKTWLLTFGHGYFTTNINGIDKKYSDKNTIRFIYKDGNMNKITYQEFQKLEKAN
ncbi:MAG: hypothetical protein COB17_00645 [Sulfurimonas sp.]|nr:MAG: hypothetical protein COB17_00645 [Sulfurimonas sp.]